MPPRKNSDFMAKKTLQKLNANVPSAAMPCYAPEITLRPCPFCGGGGRMQQEYRSPTNPALPTWCVGCPEAFEPFKAKELRRCHMQPCTTGEPSAAAAAGKWNRRANEGEGHSAEVSHGDGSATPTTQKS
jgi:hypothetical protein